MLLLLEPWGQYVANVYWDARLELQKIRKIQKDIYNLRFVEDTGSYMKLRSVFLFNDDL